MLNIVACDEEDIRISQDKISEISRSPKIAGHLGGGSKLPQSCRKVLLPQEVVVLLTDFIKIRKMAGHLTLEFSGGVITSVEAVTKKHYK